MNGLTCADVATFSWGIGALCGLVLDLVLVLAVALTPRLRERVGAQLQPTHLGRWSAKVRESPRARGWLLRLPTMLIIALWFGGLLVVGVDRISCHAIYSAAAASIIFGAVLLLLVFTASTQITNRSLWW